MATSFQLPTWANPPKDNDISDRARIITKALSEMQAQMKVMREEVIAAEALKQITCGWAAKSSHRDVKDSGKLPKSKLK